jgi:predicted phosphodiesterase
VSGRVRYGVIADVHGNLPALETVIAALQRVGVDGFVCAGDLVGYGPQPNECVELVRSLEAVSVAGNHDMIALGTLSTDRCERLARESLRWTREVLDEASLTYLAGLPPRAELPGIVVAHGSLDDPQEYVLRVDQAAAQLDRLAEAHPAARVLVVGHTHRAFASDGVRPSPRLGARRRVALAGADRWLLNPGAVGQSREPRVRARFMVLDLERLEATFHAVHYDVRRSRALLRAQRLPTRSLHLAPWRLKAVLRPAIRLLSPLRSRVRRS